MGKSTKRGPDWTDVMTMIQALEALHGVSIHAVVRSQVGQIGPYAVVELIAVCAAPPPLTAEQKWIWSRQAGVGALEELGSVLYNGCYELEKKLMRERWIQTEMPEA